MGKWGPVTVVGVPLAIASVLVFIAVPSENFKGACNEAAASDPFLKAVELLDSIIQLGITLSTGLIGLGAALLLGLQGSLRPTPWTLAILAGSMTCLAQAILYGISWKAGIANLWFNSCWEKINAEFLQYRYSVSFDFFMAGILLLGLLVALIALQRIREIQ
ncbi:hypothetical protein [Mesorhizobium sp. CA7]|uniref:hypothetical protein n=1 Tax=Mesorhizobium sp. CA7 TaxID=588501 RepID=UPI001CCA463A|nr:hypothetical protein [Mesorhizobium sp. CA7]MBZ9815747.1 hypothetical protein [Mesorhizobium sp. CA7]